MKVRHSMDQSCQFSYQILEEQPLDVPGIQKVNLAAFKNQSEANLVDQLRDTCAVFISLVAKCKDKVIGHILFTPVQIIAPGKMSITGIGLAPLAVLPEYQGSRIGSALCRSGLEKINMLGYPFIVVLGHPEYYARFGFKPAKNHNIFCALEGVPEEAFMIKIFDSAIMKDVAGSALYRQEFTDLT